MACPLLFGVVLGLKAFNLLLDLHQVAEVRLREAVVRGGGLGILQLLLLRPAAKCFLSLFHLGPNVERRRWMFLAAAAATTAVSSVFIASSPLLLHWVLGG